MRHGRRGAPGPHGSVRRHPRGAVRRARPGPRVALVGASLVVGVLTLAAWALLGVFLVVGAVEEPFWLFAILASILLVKHRRRRRRLAAAGTAPLPRRPPPPPRPDLAWSRARDRFAALRSAYAAHECDPMAVLRLPALSDVSVPSTARFVDAFAEAQALHTDAFPGESPAASYVTAVERAEHAWHAARDAAERIRLGNLTPEERGCVERVVKLLTTARDSDNDAERLVAYARARTELEKLDRAGVIHMPRTARAVLEVVGRGQLPG